MLRRSARAFRGFSEMEESIPPPGQSRPPPCQNGAEGRDCAPARLSPEDTAEFEEDFLAEAENAHPARGNGGIIFRFPRLFFTACKNGRNVARTRILLPVKEYAMTPRGDAASGRPWPGRNSAGRCGAENIPATAVDQ